MDIDKLRDYRWQGRRQQKKEGIASVLITGAAGKTKTLIQTITLSGNTGDKFPFSFTYDKVVVKFIYSKASGSIWFDLASLIE
jgi:hypothetical protein